MKLLPSVWSMGVTRAGVGAAFLTLPRTTAAAWVGDATAAQPGVDVLARALGARELVLGAGLVLAVARGRPVKGWLMAGVVADVADAAVSVAAREELPRAKVIMVATVAAFSAAAGAHLAFHLGR
ncbi:MAG: hypothetical protein ACRD0O_14450 [Acidimicrobiia bacterium]